MLVIPAFGRQKQEDYEFKASLGFKVRLSLSLSHTHTHKNNHKMKSKRSPNLSKDWFCAVLAATVNKKDQNSVLRYIQR
jgi:hypothetical protein